MPTNIGIILASTREARIGERIARWVQNAATQREGWRVEWIDLADWVLPNYPHAKSPRVFELNYPDEREREWVKLVTGIDGFIIVTPEYNHAYPASLKNALDYVYAGWIRKPVAFVSYGGPSGGIHATRSLLPVVVELHMAPVRDEVNIPFVFRALDEHGVPTDPFLHKRLGTMLEQLSWWAVTLKAGREKSAG